MQNVLRDYQATSALTDKLEPTDLTLPLIGFNGEVGSILSALKKYRRDRVPSEQFLRDIEGEIGDALWYLAAICRRSNFSLSEIATEFPAGSIWSVEAPPAKADLVTKNLEDLLFELVQAAAQLLNDRAALRSDSICNALEIISLIVIKIEADPERVICTNTEKILSRFEGTWVKPLPDFDHDFPSDEQLPRHFTVEIRRKTDEVSYLIYRGVKIGDPLRDNFHDDDGYRYHDVFHLTNAAILGWSPVFRALLKNKRKSDPRIDNTEDSGRAIVIEEGVSAWIFSIAKSYNYFEGVTSLPYDFLSVLQTFVRGCEVDRCPMWLWQKSILTGFEIFREIKRVGEGRIVGNMVARTAHFEPL